MCLFPSAPDVPAPTPAPAAAATVTQSDPAVAKARDDERRRRIAATGRSSTILTSMQGDTTAAPVQQKTLLGS